MRSRAIARTDRTPGFRFREPTSARLAQWIGVTGTTIVVRLSAFLLFCIGIQVMWNGAAELLGTLPFNPVS